MPAFRIGDRLVGDDEPPVIIAELGINHGGSLAEAVKLADAAIDAGAEVIKHQTHCPEDEMSDEARDVIPGNAEESIFDIISRCALNEEDELELKRHVESRGAIFLSTPFSRFAVDRLARFGVSAVKIGSGECNNLPLIEYISQLGVPVILSTGMQSIETVEPAVKILRKHEIPFALLHATNLYPTPLPLVRLGAISQLKRTFPDAVVGLSDHSPSPFPCVAAVALGARILERHFTDSHDRTGPDISSSMDANEFALIRQAVSDVFQASGGQKEPLLEERVTQAFAFASVVAVRDIEPGDCISLENAWVMRPGTGHYPARYFSQVLGRTATKRILKGRQFPQDCLHPPLDVR